MKNQFWPAFILFLGVNGAVFAYLYHHANKYITDIHFVLAIQIIEVCVGGLLIYNIHLVKKENHANTIARALQILLTKALGGSGKGKALQTLLKNGEPLRGIDLSSETHGVPVYIDDIDLSYESLERRAYLNFANLQGSILENVKLQWADLSGKDLQGANLSGVNFATCLNCQYVKSWGYALERYPLRNLPIGYIEYIIPI